MTAKPITPGDRYTCQHCGKNLNADEWAKRQAKGECPFVCSWTKIKAEHIKRISAAANLTKPPQ